MKIGQDIPDKNYDRIPEKDRVRVVSWGTQGYIVQDPWGNQTVKRYPKREEIKG